MIAVTGGSIALAGCIGEEEDTPSGNGMDEGDGTNTVQVRSHIDLGEILVGPEGLTLYQFDADEQGSAASACSGSCVDNWPPLTVDGEPTVGENVTADITTFERSDGGTQVSANGWPLYYYANDAEPGDATGHGANDVWWVLQSDGTVLRSDEGSMGTDNSASGY